MSRAYIRLFVVLGGLPLFLPVLLWLGEEGLAGRNPIYWYFWVNAAISAPHVYSTYVRLWRKTREGRTSPLWGLPAYAACAALLATASLRGLFVEALTAVNLLQSFHYLRQTYGVGRMYGRDDGETPRESLLLFAAYHAAMPLLILGRWDVLYTVWRGQASDAIIPMRIPAAVMTACWIAAAAGVAAGAWAERRKIRRLGAEYDATGAAILAVYYGVHWFGFMSERWFQTGFFAVTIFHAVQYFSVVYAREREHGTLAGPGSDLLWYPAAWGVLFALGYAWENALAPRGNVLWPAFASVALAAVSLHHYAADAVIWRAKAGR